MPKMQSYRVLSRTTDRRSYISELQQTLTPDDWSPHQIAEAIESQICSVWQSCLGTRRPFQLGPVQHREGIDTLVSVTVAPEHLVSLQIEFLDSRPATPEEIEAAAAMTQEMPEMRFIPDTEQPPA